MGLTTPLALLMMAALGLPIAAHLIRRRDKLHVTLPTIALLHRAQARDQQRRRLAEWLLLALRLLLVATIVFALSDPYLRRYTYAAGTLSSVVIVLDDSMSMSVDDEEPLRRGLSHARKVVASLIAGSQVSIVLAGRKPRLALALTDSLGGADEVLDGIGPTARGTDLEGALAIARQQLASATNDGRIVLISDFGRHTKSAELALPSRWPIDIVDVGGEGAKPNFHIVHSEATPDPTTADRALVNVAIAGVDENVDVVLTHRGDEVARARVPIEHGRGRATLSAPWVEKGDPTANVRILRPDALAMDNEQAILLRPEGAIEALLVDGDPDPSRARDEVGFLVRAIDAASSGARRVRHRIVDRDGLEREQVDHYDIVVLANTRAPSVATTQSLIDFVANGGGLWITGGQNVEPQVYRRRFGDALGATPTSSLRAKTPWTLKLATPPVALRSLQGFEATLVRRALMLEERSNGRTELSLSNGAPLLTFGEHGRGRTAILATSVDDAWSDLPYQPAFVAFVSRTIEHLTANVPRIADRIEPGASVSFAGVAGKVEIRDPAGASHRLSGKQELSSTDRPGAYRVFVDGQEKPRLAFIVVPAASESDLRPGTPPKGASSEQSATPIGRTSLMPWLLLLAGLFFAIEGIVRVRWPVGLKSLSKILSLRQETRQL